MNHVKLIALNTVREHLRDKLFYNLAFFAVLVTGSAGLVSRLTIGDYQRVLLDIGLGAMNMIGVLIALLIGISLLGREWERRTLYLVLTKPVSRVRLIMGKYIGVLVTLLLNLALMAAGLIAVLWVMATPVTPAFVQSLLGIYLECAVVAAIAIVFSTCTTMTLSAMCTLALYVIGHSANSLRIQPFLDKAVSLLPNLELFNLKGPVIAGTTLPAVDVFLLVGYAATYVSVLLTVAAMIFQRRDVQ